MSSNSSSYFRHVMLIFSNLKYIIKFYCITLYVFHVERSWHLPLSSAKRRLLIWWTKCKWQHWKVFPQSWGNSNIGTTKLQLNNIQTIHATLLCFSLIDCTKTRMQFTMWIPNGKKYEDVLACETNSTKTGTAIFLNFLQVLYKSWVFLNIRTDH